MMFCLDGGIDMNQQSILLSASALQLDAHVGRAILVAVLKLAIVLDLDAVACACCAYRHISQM